MVLPEQSDVAEVVLHLAMLRNALVVQVRHLCREIQLKNVICVEMVRMFQNEDDACMVVALESGATTEKKQRNRGGRDVPGKFPLSRGRRSAERCRPCPHGIAGGEVRGRRPLTSMVDS